jgi:hypothetical protein
VWVACFGWAEVGNLYVGFAQMTRDEACEALRTNATVVLFGGYGQASAQPLLRQFDEAVLPTSKVG